VNSRAFVGYAKPIAEARVRERIAGKVKAKALPTLIAITILARTLLISLATITYRKRSACAVSGMR